MAGYSCCTANETVQWIHAIVNFLKPYRFLMETHVVNFFKDRLWEAVDKEWIDCLRNEPVENLLQIPSGVVQVHWPDSLKEFILTSRSLALPREQTDLQKAFPDLHVNSLNSVLTQGMNWKKKHEIEVLAAVVSSVARSVEANKIVDVGAGQGYLSQVLSFEYQFSVIAIDASSHHGRVADARAERIKKYYGSRLRKTRLEDGSLIIPKTITRCVLSPDMLHSLSSSLTEDYNGKPNLNNEIVKRSCLLLAGLHACGDLSVTMLRTFVECRDVKAVLSIGCCYNLLSEEGIGCADSLCGFPMSEDVKSAGISLGRNSRDLACQSAERWKGLEKGAGLHNFELHAFRAAFQMVLFQHCPEILSSSPAIGRQGKALRRQLNRKFQHSTLDEATKNIPPSSEVQERKISLHLAKCSQNVTVNKGGLSWGSDTSIDQGSPNQEQSQETKIGEKCFVFERFSRSGLSQLGLDHLQDIDFTELWKKYEPFAELIGPYWSLRAALGPVLETIILLDRLLFLQDQGNSVEVVMLPIFDPIISPRNMALIAKKL